MQGTVPLRRLAAAGKLRLSLSLHIQSPEGARAGEAGERREERDPTCLRWAGAASVRDERFSILPRNMFTPSGPVLLQEHSEGV